MKPYNSIQSRRKFLKNFSYNAIAITTAGTFINNLLCTTAEVLAKDLTLTPRQAEGPFYPDKALLDTDNNWIYLHTKCPKQDQRDRNFQGLGRTITNSSGEYYFRTIKPVFYDLDVKRTPYIHFIVRKGDKRLLTTQMYIKEHPWNEKDFIFQRIQGKAGREAVLVDFEPIKESDTGELKAHFDIVLGTTPEDMSKDINRNRDGIPYL